MANLIPRQLRPDLSPLLVAAGEWPMVTRLTRPADERRLAALAERDRLRPDPALARQLLETARDLLHPALLGAPAGGRERSGPGSDPAPTAASGASAADAPKEALEPDDERLHWTPPPDRELYYRLRHAVRPDPTTDPHAAWSAWAGWASWAPSKVGLPAFCVHAWVAKRLGPADASLFPMLDQVLKPALADELKGPRTTRTPSPAVRGPDHHVEMFILSEAGFGVAYPYVYAYTDGERLVLAAQPVAHGTLSFPP